MAESENSQIRTTPFAREVQFDTYKQNKLDQLQSLRQVYARTRVKNSDRGMVTQAQESLGPKNEPGLHLRPQSPARRAVDEAVHQEQLAQSRAAAEKRAAEVLKQFQNRQAQRGEAKSSGQSR